MGLHAALKSRGSANGTLNYHDCIRRQEFVEGFPRVPALKFEVYRSRGPCPGITRP